VGVGSDDGCVCNHVPGDGDPHVPEFPQRGLPHHIQLHRPRLLFWYRGEDFLGHC
jgi:hypothetical protein